MNNNVKLILKDVGYALLAVVLYSPGLLALSPADPSIFRAGCSIMGGLFIGYGLIKTNIIDAKAPLKIGTEKMGSVSDAINVLEDMSAKGIFGDTIRESLTQLRRAHSIESRFHVVVDEKFPPGSMSNEKFNGTAALSIAAIVKNCRAMVARINMFDENDYMNIKRLIETGEYLRDDVPDNIQQEKYEIYEKNYRSIRDMVNTNEKILIRLDALAVEISTLDIRDISVENNDIINEIESLIEETKYYQ